MGDATIRPATFHRGFPVLAAAGLGVCGVVLSGLGLAAPAAAQNHKLVPNDTSLCSGSGPAIWIALDGVSTSAGKVRVQLYRATAAEWLEKGKWINRIEVPARAGRMMICMPVPGPGTYGIAARHDVNGNGKTDLSTDGGGMSNNPSLNIFNLGKPNYSKVALPVGREVKSIQIRMRYM